MNELWTKSAGDLARMIRARTVSAREVIDAHLGRIDMVNPTVNAITVTLAESARAAADAIDRALASGADPGPLAGVPFTVKENIDVAGSATTWGVPAFAGQIATIDAPAVAHLRRAGAIPLARTNMADFAFRWHTESAIAGHTRNPWDPTRTPGGSSGGEAVALATGMSPLGLGNDLGGSLRIPSQMCGTAALRPTAGRVADAASTEPSVTAISLQMLNCQGPMARRIADLRLALEILSQPDCRDARWVPAPLAGPPLQHPIKVVVVRDPLGIGVDSHVRAGVDRAASWLADAGYELTELAPPDLAEAAEVWLDVIGADFVKMWPFLESLAGDGLVRFVREARTAGALREVDQDGQMAAWTSRQRIANAWSVFLADHPIVLGPVVCERPWTVGDDLRRPTEMAAAMRMVLPVNVLGLPSCAVPVGCDDGLPQGVQLIGARFREDVLLDAAQAIEDAAGTFTPIDPRASRCTGER